jgi:hypothetical protein
MGFQETKLQIRVRVAALVPAFLEAHCDLSDPDAYTDAALLVDVFTRFLRNQDPALVASFYRDRFIVSNLWLAEVFRDVCNAKRGDGAPPLVFAGWCKMQMWTQWTGTDRNPMFPSAIVGLKLKRMQAVFGVCRCCAPAPVVV